jgi:hypothetical protein
MDSNVSLRFMVQALQDPPLCSSTVRSVVDLDGTASIWRIQIGIQSLLIWIWSRIRIHFNQSGTAVNISKKILIFQHV